MWNGQRIGRLQAPLQPHSSTRERETESDAQHHLLLHGGGGGAGYRSTRAGGQAGGQASRQAMEWNGVCVQQQASKRMA